MASKTSIECVINGKRQTLETYPMARLLDVLRQDLGLTGSKEGCGEGECGACSVFIDGKLVNSCLVPMAQAAGRSIETIESLSPGGEPTHPIQRAFMQFGGAQCGICTPGMVMAAKYLLAKDPKPSQGKVREFLAGNLCRCTGYTKIVESVLRAADEGKLA